MTSTDMSNSLTPSKQNAPAVRELLSRSRGSDGDGKAVPPSLVAGSCCALAPVSRLRLRDSRTLYVPTVLNNRSVPLGVEPMF